MYTTDWFSHNEQSWKSLLLPLLRPQARILEIGVYEGRFTKWILSQIKDSSITCIDPYAPAEEHAETDMEQVYQRFVENLSPEILKGRVTLFRNLSQEVLRSLRREYSLVYIDGSHQALMTLADAAQSWQLLVDGGILVFDDYEWTSPVDGSSPKPAIDLFIQYYAPEVLHKGYQVFMRKGGKNAR